MPGDDFFDSLPTGLFENLEGIKTRGTMIRGCSAHVPTFENSRECLISRPLKEWDESAT
jgi:hypothetical protein